MTRQLSRTRPDMRLRPIAGVLILISGFAVWMSSRAVGAVAVPSVQFEAARSYGSTVSSRLPDLGDFDGDGRIEPLGSLQRADGTFATVEGATMGLSGADQLGASDHLKTFRIADFSGDGRDDVLAVAYAERLHKDFKSWYQVIMDAGGLGQKNGRGFYIYGVTDGRPSKVANPDTRARIAALAKPARQFPEQQVVERIMVGMAIELAQALEEGIVASPQEADVALLYGVGFPAFRGGLARWMDTVGLEAFCRMADQYVAELGPLYRVTGRQRDMARRAATFYP